MTLDSTFTYEHSSGRFDRTPASVKADLTIWERDPELTLMTLTEFANNPRVKALVETGWQVFNGKEAGRGADECAIRWKLSEWKLLASTVEVISTVRTWSTTGHEHPPQVAMFVLLQHLPTKKRVLVSVSHMPSHVEVAGGLRANFNRSVRWRDAVKNWKKRKRQLRKEWGAKYGTIHAEILTADWNVNLRTRWFRRYLENQFPAMNSVWRAPFPKWGTLGRRIIDVPLIRGLKRVARPVKLQHRSSDHTAFKVRLRFA